MNDEKKYDINYKEISTITVDGQDATMDNQDARKVYISKNGIEKRTGNFMLGNDGKNLENGEYINIEEYEKAVIKIFENSKRKVIKLKKTGKKISSMAELRKHIEAVKKANLIVLKPNSKVTNQDARIVSVKTENMNSQKNVSGMFLGKNGIDMANGEYTTKSDLEFEIVDKKTTALALPKIPKALGTIAVSVGLIAIIPYVMHANSVLWHHVNPTFQSMLHAVNQGLGSIIFSSFEKGNGLWTALGGHLINADAAVASVGMALATHGVAITGVTKVINDIKGLFNKNKKNDTYDLDEEGDKEGGREL